MDGKAWLMGAAVCALMGGGAHAQDLGELRLGQSVQGRLDTDDEPTNANGYFDCYAISAAEGAEAEITLRSDAFSPLLAYVTGCDGEILDANSAARGQTARVTAKADQFGIFIRVMTRGAPVTGAYVLEAKAVGGVSQAAATGSASTPSAQPASSEDMRAVERACIDTVAANRSAAIAACTRIAEHSDYEPWRGLFERGRRRLEGRDHAGALADFSQVVEQNPALSEGWLFRGETYESLGQYVNARADYESAVERDTASPQALLILAGYFERRGDPRLSEATLTRAVEQFPQSDEAWFGRAELRAGTENLAGAVADLDRGLELAPENGLRTAQRGLLRVMTGDQTGGEADIVRAVQLSPTDGTVWRFKGAVEERQARHQDAVASLTEAIRLLPDQAIVFLARSNNYLTLKDYARAAADADRAAELAPTNSIAHNQRCWIRAVANTQLDTARAACDRSLELSRDAGTLDSRGLVGLRQGRFQEAWTDYDAAVRLKPQVASYLYGRGLAALRLGRTAEGQADLVAALGKDAGVAKEYSDMGEKP